MTKQTLLLIGATALITACGGEVQDPGHDHRCQVISTNFLWTSVHLDLIHNDSRQCPQSPAYNELVSTGGTLKTNRVYGSVLTTGDPLDVQIDVHRSDGGCADPVADIVGQVGQGFAWNDYDYDGNQDWIAQPSVSYHARTGADDARDCPVFSVRLAYYQPTDRAIAITELNYFGTLPMKAAALR